MRCHSANCSACCAIMPSWLRQSPVHVRHTQGVSPLAPHPPGSSQGRQSSRGCPAQQRRWGRRSRAGRPPWHTACTRARAGISLGVGANARSAHCRCSLRQQENHFGRPAAYEICSSTLRKHTLSNSPLLHLHGRSASALPPPCLPQAAAPLAAPQRHSATPAATQCSGRKSGLLTTRWPGCTWRGGGRASWYGPNSRVSNTSSAHEGL